MDNDFEQFKNQITSIENIVTDKDENYFMTMEEIKGEVDSNQVPIENNEDDEIVQIIKQYENNIKTN